MWLNIKICNGTKKEGGNLLYKYDVLKNMRSLLNFVSYDVCGLAYLGNQGGKV